MRLNHFLNSATLAAALLSVPAAAQTPPAQPAARHVWARYAHADAVELRDVAGFVRIYPENRTDVAVSVINAGPLRAPEYRRSRNRLIIDGKLRGQIRSCHVGERGGFEVETTRQGRVSAAQLPTYNIRVPQDALVTAAGAVRVHMNAAQSTRFRVAGCGDADLYRVEDTAEIGIAGSPNVRLYDGGRVTVAVAGSGDATLGVVREGLTASIAGSGDLLASRVDGPTSLTVQGSGDVIIRDGRASTLNVVIAGAGDVTHNGVADTLDVVIVGRGDVHVRRVEGAVTRRILGGGAVIIGH